MAQTVGRIGTSLRNSYNTMSLPGTLRRAKQKLIGINRMPDDPFVGRRQEIQELDAVISVVKSSIQTLKNATDMLVGSPSVLTENLQKVYAANSVGATAVRDMSSIFITLRDRLQRGESFLQKVSDGLAQMSQENSDCHEAFKQRDSTWQTETHYARKVGNLQRELERQGPSPSLAAKLARNSGKWRESQQDFADTTHRVVTMSENILAKKDTSLSLAISNFCRYYIVVFEATNLLAQDLAPVAERLSGTGSSASNLAQTGRQVVGSAAAKGREIWNATRGMVSSAQDQWIPCGRSDGADRGSGETSELHGVGAKHISQPPMVSQMNTPPAKVRDPFDHFSKTQCWAGGGFGGFGGFDDGHTQSPTPSSQSFSWPGDGCGGSGGSHGATAPSATRLQSGQPSPLGYDASFGGAPFGNGSTTGRKSTSAENPWAQSQRHSQGTFPYQPNQARN